MNYNKALVLGLLTMTALTTKAQIYFRNNSPEPVYVAFARYVNLVDKGYWQTQGWWTVNAGQTYLAFQTIGAGDTIGYWCMTTVSTKIFEGTKRLLVHPDEKFIIAQADQQKANETHPAWDWYKFRLVLMPPGSTSGTITFNE